MKKESSNLKRLIRSKGMTVKAFAEQAGLSRRSLDHYVTGEKQFDKTQFWFAMKVADALEVDPHELIENR